MSKVTILTSTATQEWTTLRLYVSHVALDLCTVLHRRKKFLLLRQRTTNRQRNYLQFVKQLPLVVIQSFDLFLQSPYLHKKRGRAGKIIFPYFTSVCKAAFAACQSALRFSEKIPQVECIHLHLDVNLKPTFYINTFWRVGIVWSTPFFPFCSDPF